MCWIKKKLFVVMLLVMTGILEAEFCLLHQKVGKPAKNNPYSIPPYERKLYQRKFQPLCECGKLDSSFERLYFYHLHARILPYGQELSCMVTPVASNLLLVSHHCLTKNGRTLRAYDSWPVSQDTKNIAKLSELRADSMFWDDAFVSVTVKDVVVHPKFAVSMPASNHVSENDLAIIVINENLMELKSNTFCLPKPGVSTSTPLYQWGEYVGSGGLFVGDNTTETRMVTRTLILTAKECIAEGNLNITTSGDNYCVRFRDEGPESPGGPLTVYGVASQTQYLMGLASIVNVERKHTALKYVFFTSVLPHIDHIEQVAAKHKSEWCEMRVMNLPEPVPMEDHKLKLHPWEGDIQIPARVVDSTCVCGIRSEANPIPPPTPLPPAPPSTRSASPRIAGGEEARRYEFPWMIRLDIGNDVIGWSFCGASLINDKMILTAAHCVIYQNPNSGQIYTFQPKEINAWAHAHQIWDDMVTDPVTQLPKHAIPLYIEQVHVYPDYYAGRFKFLSNHDMDIAILILYESVWKMTNVPVPTSTDITDDVKIRPVCLPERGKTIELEGQTAYLSGWGLTGHSKFQDPRHGPSAVLKKGAYPIRPLKECANFTYGTITRNVICATSYSVHDSALPGDSGSPLTAELGQDGLRTQIGLTSYGDEFDRKEHEGIHLVLYTNIQRFLNYIDLYASAFQATWCKTKI